MLLLHKAAFLQQNWCKPRFIHISSANHGGGGGREKQTPELFEYCRLHLGSEYRHQRAMPVPGSGCHWGLPVVLLFSLQNPRMAWAGMP